MSIALQKLPIDSQEFHCLRVPIETETNLADDVHIPAGIVFCGDNMRITFPGADMSTEPDGMFVSYESLQSGRIRKIAGKNGGVTELEGIPDMVLEVVSDSSVVKDTVDLPALYHRAGVPEFWRVDARLDECRFEVLIRGEDSYFPAIQANGWQKSSIFDKWFRLERTLDPLGDPLFELQVKD